LPKLRTFGFSHDLYRNTRRSSFSHTHREASIYVTARLFLLIDPIHVPRWPLRGRIVFDCETTRCGEQFVVEFDLPGVEADSIDLDVERNVVTVRAERSLRDTDAELIAAERPRGVLRRQLILGDTPDTDRVQASYSAGVLTLRIPVAKEAHPGKITNAVPDADRAALAG